MASFGPYPDTSLKLARERRDKLRKDIAEGRDPNAKAIDFEAVARRYIAETAPKRCEAHETYSLRRMNECFASFGSEPVDKIEPHMIASVLQGIAGRGAPSMADKARALCNQIFRYAIGRGLCARNPAENLSGLITMPPTRPRPAVALSELPALIQAIDAYKGDAVTRLALKLLFHTFLRVEELVDAEWPEIDAAAAVLIVPAPRTKMKRCDHVVPLSRQALAIIGDLRAINGDQKFVFASGRKGKPISKNTTTYALYRCGYHKQMCSHGFRSVASTLLNELYAAGISTFGSDLIEKQLDHIDKNEVRRAYNRSQYLRPRAEMMQYYSDCLDDIGTVLEKLKM